MRPLVLIIAFVVVAAVEPARADMRPESVRIPLETFQNSKKAGALQGMFWRAQSSGEKKPAILLVPSQGSDHKNWSSLAEKLQQEGYNILSVDLRDRGKEAKGRLLEDVQSGVVFLRTDTRLGQPKVALIGAGTGADAVAQYAASTRQMHLLIQSITLLSPGETPSYKGVPAFLVAAEDDKPSADLVQKAQQTCSTNCRVQVYPSGGHGTELLHSSQSDALSNAILGFLQDPRGGSTR